MRPKTRGESERELSSCSNVSQAKISMIVPLDPMTYHGQKVLWGLKGSMGKFVDPMVKPVLTMGQLSAHGEIPSIP